MKQNPETLDAATEQLMLYVAGELDGEARVAFENRLAADATLRAELNELAAVDAMLKRDAVGHSLNESDARQSLNRTLRAVREQVLVGLARDARSKVRPPFRLPSWAWGTAVAAALVIGFVFWVVNSDPSTPTLTQNNTDNRGPFPPEFIGVVTAFGRFDNGLNVEELNEVQHQIDALDMLSNMNESVDDFAGEAN